MKGICLGGYLLGKELGHGKYGRVYSGADIHDKDLVFAIKVFYEQFFSDPNFRKRFNAEAKALYSLEHPNIVRYFHRAIVEYTNEHGNVKEAAIIVTELVEGKTLEQILATEKLSKERAVNITLQVLYALEHAHSKGVLHRDIHPGQIIVRDDGIVKVADFGLAKIAGISQETGTITSTATAKGNRYAAPEGQKDERSDIYSVGMIFYELLKEKGGSVKDSRLSSLIEKATQTFPEKRYNNVKKFLDDLNNTQGLEDKIKYLQPFSEGVQWSSDAYNLKSAVPGVLTHNCILLRDIHCIDARGRVFEKYDNLFVMKDIVRTSEDNPVMFDPYDAIFYFEKQGKGLSLPSFALTCNVLARLFQLAVKEVCNGYYITLNEELKQIMEQYANFDRGFSDEFGWHAQNTLVCWNERKIIHYPADSDFPEAARTVANRFPAGFDIIRVGDAITDPVIKDYLLNNTLWGAFIKDKIKDADTKQIHQILQELNIASYIERIPRDLKKKSSTPPTDPYISINEARTRIVRRISPEIFGDNLCLEEALENIYLNTFVRDLTGLKNPEVLIDIGKYFKKSAQILLYYYPTQKHKDTCYTWLGCGAGLFGISAATRIWVPNAARGVATELHSW